MNLVRYALRQVGTQNYMPAHRAGAHRSGFSWDEPVLDGGEFGPRLFLTTRSAQNALISWLQGCWKKEVSGGHGGFGFDDSYEENLVPTEPEKPRKREVMEIVTFYLTEGAVFYSRRQRRALRCEDGECSTFRNMNGGCDECGSPSL